MRFSLTFIEILALVLIVPFSIWLIYKALADPTDSGIFNKEQNPRLKSSLANGNEQKWMLDNMYL